MIQFFILFFGSKSIPTFEQKIPPIFAMVNITGSGMLNDTNYVPFLNPFFGSKTTPNFGAKTTPTFVMIYKKSCRRCARKGNFERFAACTDA